MISRRHDAGVAPGASNVSARGHGPSDLAGFIERRPALVLVRLVGGLDVYTVAQFSHDVLEACDPAETQLVVDLRDSPMVDSAGLGALAKLASLARAGGRRVGIVSSPQGAQRIFAIAGLSTAFVFGRSVDEVRHALDRERRSPPLGR
jgi:anti-anti-sigma factor